MPNEFFVIGTGRCGSTLISNILNHHPDVLSLSEFFTFVTDLGTLIPQAFPAMQINGKQFWQIVSGVYAKQNIMLAHDIAIKEVLYPFKTSVRFNASTGVPAILQTTLPHLASGYDALFDQIRAVIAARGMATAEAHYHALFGWLAAHFGKSIWVERSGGSLRVIERLYQHFPNAKFLHIVRDGRDCALSMQRHNGFKMVLLVFQITEILGIDPYESDDRSWQDDLPDELISFLPESFSGKDFLAYDVPPSLYGHYWSGEIMAGLDVLDRIPAAQQFTLQYESILTDTRNTIEHMIQFVSPDSSTNAAWCDAVMSSVKRPTAAWQTLDAREQSRLNDACAPGFAALTKRGIRW